MGGSRLVHTAANLVVLCGSGVTGCHGAVESERARAGVDGWLIEGTVATPETVPVLRHGRQRVFPTADGWVPAVSDGGGGWTPAEIPC